MNESTRKDVEHGGSNAKNLIAELDRRLTEDETTPNDTVSWETIRAEAQTRYGAEKQIAPKLNVEQLKAAIAQGLASGPGISATETFDRLENKYRKLATGKHA